MEGGPGTLGPEGSPSLSGGLGLFSGSGGPGRAGPAAASNSSLASWLASATCAENSASTPGAFNVRSLSARSLNCPRKPKSIPNVASGQVRTLTYSRTSLAICTATSSSISVRPSNGVAGDIRSRHDAPRRHPVRRRPTHRGAGLAPGVQVERPTGRTTWTPGAKAARLCLGRRRTGWQPPQPNTTGTRTPGPCHPGRRSAPAGGIVLAGASRAHGCPTHLPPERARVRGASADGVRRGPKAGARRAGSRERPGGAERSRGCLMR